MPNVLLASPSAFLRIGLMQQLRRRERRFAFVETSTTGQAARLLLDNAIDLAIVDDTLLADVEGERLRDVLLRYARKALLIAMGGPRRSDPAADAIPVIAGRTNGILDMGGIARALNHALDTPAAPRPMQRPEAPPSSVPGCGREPARRAEIILVAASTGGPGALATLFGKLGPPAVPVVVAQHMPADQTEAFSRHLAVETGLSVSECASGQLPGAQVTVLHGGSDYRIRRAAGLGFWLSTVTLDGNAFHPCADMLFTSAAEAGIRAAVVVLSGMGEDGARGAAAMAARGGGVLVQSFDSCVVPGMPQATRAACPSAIVASLTVITERLARWTSPFFRPDAAMAEENRSP
jgi:two-component system, chemotaxis family, protein-glutamate methylesterase/glutaminase